MKVNEHVILFNITLRETQIKVKEQLVVVVRKDIDVNEHVILFNITLRETQIKETVLLLLFYITHSQ